MPICVLCGPERKLFSGRRVMKITKKIIKKNVKKTIKATAMKAAVAAVQPEVVKDGQKTKKKYLVDWQFLKDSEKKMVAIFGPEDSGKPVPPEVDKMPGSYEYGPILYLINNELINIFGKHLELIIELILYELFGMPKSTITKAQWKKYMKRIKGEGYWAGDGTLIQGQINQRNKFVAIDPGWAYAAVEYFLRNETAKVNKYLKILAKYPLLKLSINEFIKNELWGRAKFNTTPATVKFTNKKYKIAVIGDWGTGKWEDGRQSQCPSQLVMKQVNSKKPDIIIHLGDVYYAGTNKSMLSEYKNEEKNNLVKIWDQFIKTGPKSFTLNSNHEMYGGGKGYFDVALKDGLFKEQKNTSYFSLEFKSFVILGLDSAYFDKSSLYMDGAFFQPKNPKSQKQREFIQQKTAQARKHGKKIIIMTHHNPIQVDGTLDKKKRVLWDQMVTAMTIKKKKNYPDYWYWGHIHAGIVYTKGCDLGKFNVKSRCSGHAAIPFSKAFILKHAKAEGIVSYYANTLMKETASKPAIPAQKNRMLNGWTMITLDGSEIIEEFYETGNPKPVWSNQ